MKIHILAAVILCISNIAAAEQMQDKVLDSVYGMCNDYSPHYSTYTIQYFKDNVVVSTETVRDIEINVLNNRFSYILSSHAQGLIPDGVITTYKSIDGQNKQIPLLKATFKFGKRNGVHINYSFDGSTTSVMMQYSNNIPQGRAVAYNPDDSRFECTYKNGILSGTFSIINANNQPNSTVEYQDGLKHGVTRTYHPDGKLLAEAQFKKDVLSGEFKTFYSSGKVNILQFYHNDQLIGLTTYFYDSGSIMKTVNMTNEGLKIGTVTTYYPDGKVYQIEHYNHGLLDGLMETFSQDGSPWETIKYELSIPKSFKVHERDVSKLPKYSFHPTVKVEQVPGGKLEGGLSGFALVFRPNDMDIKMFRMEGYEEVSLGLHLKYTSPIEFPRKLFGTSGEEFVSNYNHRKISTPKQMRSWIAKKPFIILTKYFGIVLFNPDQNPHMIMQQVRKKVERREGVLFIEREFLLEDDGNNVWARGLAFEFVKTDIPPVYDY